jgi:hypothetical protein
LKRIAARLRGCGSSHKLASPVCCVVVAGVIQLVECQLPKLDVAGSSPVARSHVIVPNATSETATDLSEWRFLFGY